MTRYIVAYDLSVRGTQNYSGLLKRIKSYAVWAKLSQSCYMVVSDESAEEVRNHLADVLSLHDTLIVSKQGASAWRGLDKKTTRLVKQARHMTQDSLPEVIRLVRKQARK